MNLKQVISCNISLNSQLQRVFSKRLYASNAKELKNEVFDITSADEKPIYEIEDTNVLQEIEKKRNKSLLNPQDRNILFGKKPYLHSMARYHDTIRYKRRLLGRYGMEAAAVPVGIAWPTKEEIEDIKEYERVSFPLTIQERWEKIAEKHKENEERIAARESEIARNMSKLDAWIAAVNEKVEKKKLKQHEAKARKDRMMEEIREHFGYAVSKNDERFKELLLQKEQEEQKKKKEARKQTKENRYLKLFTQADKTAMKQK